MKRKTLNVAPGTTRFGHEQLDVFKISRQLAIDLFRETGKFPSEDKVRSDVADSQVCCLDSSKHRGGRCSTFEAGILKISSNGAGILDRASLALRDRARDRNSRKRGVCQVRIYRDSNLLDDEWPDSTLGRSPVTP